MATRPAAPSIFCTTRPGLARNEPHQVPGDHPRRIVDTAARGIADNHGERFARIEIGSVHFNWSRSIEKGSQAGRPRTRCQALRSHELSPPRRPGMAQAIADRRKILYQTGKGQSTTYGGGGVAGSDSVLRSPASMLSAGRWRSSVLRSGRRGRARFTPTCATSDIRARSIWSIRARRKVYGQRCYPSLRDIGEPVDLAMVIVPAVRMSPACFPTPKPPA